MLFDNDDRDPFDNEKYLSPSIKNLCGIGILTLVLPICCSYLFGKIFACICCRKRSNSHRLEGDKLWVKSLLSRWFVVIQALALGYLWCEYCESLWFEHIDTKYYTLSTGLMVLIICALIFVVIAICKLNKKLLR